MNISLNRAVSSKKRLLYSKTEVECYEYELPFVWNRNVRKNRPHNTLEGSRRTDNLQNTRQTIRRLVNANYASFGYEAVFLTFTFEANVRDVDKANFEFHQFIKRLNSKYKTRFLWLAVVEFQGRGAVHYHCIFFNMPLELEQRERCVARPCFAFREGACTHSLGARSLAILWGNGFVDIERVRSAKNVGAYVCKYLDKSVHDVRLRGRKAFFSSLGLLKPKELRTEKSIDNFFEKAENLIQVRSTEYDSAFYKKIKYTQYAYRSSNSGML